MISINAFQEIRTLLHSSTSVKEVLTLMAKKATEVIDAQGAIARILSSDASQLDSSAAYGVGEQYLSRGFLSDLKTITELYQMNKIVIIEDILNDPRVQHPREAWDEGIRMMLDVPLNLENQVTGIIRIYLTEPRVFSKDDLNFLVTCATCGACAIEKARLFEAQQSEYYLLATQTEKLSALGRMAAGIAHEINNPLAGILLYGTNLIKKVPESGPLREGLEVIISETTRCGKIIQELLDFSRAGEPNMVLTNINVIVEKALSILENEFHLHHIAVEKQLCSKMPEMLVDPNQIEQVFVNLLLNAVEAIQERGTITIRSRMSTDKTHEVVEIIDTGCGISQEHLSTIFEPFFSTKANGTGLGLAVSYGIVQKHHGNIRVHSKPARGTRFTLEFPLLLQKLRGNQDGTR